MAKQYKHITEKQRELAMNLWREFNTKLNDNGMDFFYDYEIGRFYVASSELEAGYIKHGTGGKGQTEADLDRDELDKVIEEGEFTDVPNNPPWFSDGTSYTLRVKE